MALKAVRQGYRNISLSVESTYGSPASGDYYYVPYESGGWFQRVPNQVYDDSNEITGYVEPTTAGVINWRGEGSHVRRARVNEIALFSSIALGGVTPGSGDDPITVTHDAADTITIYGHKIVPDTGADLKSRTIQECDGYNRLLVRGVICTQFQLTGGAAATNDGFCQINATLLSNGNISRANGTTQDFGKSTVTFSDPLLSYKAVNLSVTTSDITSETFYKSDLPSATDWHTRLREFSWTYNNNGTLVYRAGDSYFALGAERRSIEQSLELLVMTDEEVSTDKPFVEWFGNITQTEFALQLKLTGGVIFTETVGDQEVDHCYVIRITFPRLILTEGGVEKEDSDGFLAYRLRPKVLHDTNSNVDTSVAVWIETTLDSII